MINSQVFFPASGIQFGGEYETSAGWSVDDPPNACPHSDSQFPNSQSL